MPGDAVANFPGEVEAAPVVLEQVDDAKALLVVIEAARDEVLEHALARVAEGSVAEVVAECNRLGELLVETQDLRDASCDLGDLERMSEPRPIVIAGRRKEHLGLVLQPAERL